MRRSVVLVLLVMFYQAALPVEVFADAGAAKAYVQKVSSDVLATLKSGASDSEKVTKLENIFKKTVDAKWMGKFVLGKHYRKLGGAKKDRYLSLYEQFLIQSYIPRFKEYAGEKLKIDKVEALSDGEYLVKTELVNPDKAGVGTLVDYRLRKEASGYKVIDIVGEGISLITTQRSDFSGAISRGGVDGFVDKLAARVK